MKIGQKVKIKSGFKGRVVGSANWILADGKMFNAFVVDVGDNGFFSPDGKTYVNLLIINEDRMIDDYDPEPLKLKE